MPLNGLTFYPLFLAAALVAAFPAATRADEPEERADWKKFFAEAEAEGTIVIADERTDSKGIWFYNPARAKTALAPASTFKIPHALFALDAGVIKDEFDVIPWDGVERTYPAWNRDQTLRSSMRHSVVWVYEKFAAAIGEEQERAYLKKTGYGNADPGGTKPFWIEGDLRISAFEQIAFLRKLYRNELPFRTDHQRLVKDIMIVEAGREWIVRAKTGWSGTLGWWVGWVEHPSGPVFFALNIDTPNRKEDLPKREGITRAILASINALEPSSEN